MKKTSKKLVISEETLNAIKSAEESALRSAERSQMCADSAYRTFEKIQKARKTAKLIIHTKSSPPQGWTFSYTERLQLSLLVWAKLCELGDELERFEVQF